MSNKSFLSDMTRLINSSDVSKAHEIIVDVSFSKDCFNGFCKKTDFDEMKKLLYSIRLKFPDIETELKEFGCKILNRQVIDCVYLSEEWGKWWFDFYNVLVKAKNNNVVHVVQRRDDVIWNIQYPKIKELMSEIPREDWKKCGGKLSRAISIVAQLDEIDGYHIERGFGLCKIDEKPPKNGNGSLYTRIRNRLDTDLKRGQ